MQDSIDFQRLSILSCAQHSKRIQFFCTAEKCEKILICGECLIADKDHVKQHLDGFCSVEDYKNKIITSLFNKFGEAVLKVENKRDSIQNDIQEVNSYFSEEINKAEKETIKLVQKYFSNLKIKMSNEVNKKYQNFLDSLDDLYHELLITKYFCFNNYKICLVA